MKNRLLHQNGMVWALWIVVSIAMLGMVSCKKTYSPMDEIQKMADKNIPNSYSTMTADAEKMLMTVYEYKLAADGTGTYSEATLGDKVDASIKSEDFTWEKIGYVDNNSYVQLALQMKDGEKQIKWGSAALFVDGACLQQGSKIANAQSVFTKFANTNWQAVDSTWFLRPYTEKFKYLKWKQASPTKSYLTEEDIQKQRDYFNQQWVKDTIAWYNRAFFYTDSLAQYAGGKIAAPVPDSIRVTETQDAKGRWLCVYYTGSAATLNIPKVEHLADKNVDAATFHFDRNETSFSNTGLYSFHHFEQDSAHYLDPSAANANAKDSLYQFEIKSWSMSSISSASKFDIIARGTLTEQVWVVENGVRKELINKEQNDYEQTFSLSSFFIGDEITLDGKKFNYVK